MNSSVKGMSAPSTVPMVSLLKDQQRQNVSKGIMINGFSIKTLEFVLKTTPTGSPRKKIRNQMLPEMMANGKNANLHQLKMVKFLALVPSAHFSARRASRSKAGSIEI